MPSKRIYILELYNFLNILKLFDYINNILYMIYIYPKTLLVKEYILNGFK